MLVWILYTVNIEAGFHLFCVRRKREEQNQQTTDLSIAFM